MTSLQAFKDKEALLRWGRRLAAPSSQRLCQLDPEEVDWTVEPKVDGLAVRAVYRDGKLVLGATRGTGAQGEDITHNMKTGRIRGLPASLTGDLSGLPRELEVRGEIYMTRADFDKVNSEAAAAGDTSFSNPRNAAAGSVRLLDPSEAAGRRLSFLAFQLVRPESPPSGFPASQAAALKLLGDLGVATTAQCTSELLGRVTSWRGLTDAVQAAEQWMKHRAELGFDVDGAVLKIDNLDIQDRLGTDGAKDPRWAAAWKFPAKECVTRIRDIQWNVGRSGAITPVATLDPVEVGGVLVRHASLHNVGLMRELGLYEGAMVMLKRAGDVIPQIVGRCPDPAVANEAHHGKPFQAPTCCPSCTRPLEFVEGKGKDVKGNLWCRNPSCPDQHLQHMKHFVAVCVKGVGDATATEFWRRGWLNTPADLYKITKEDLLSLSGVKERKASNILAAINASKRVGLATLLAGLGIGDLGERQAANLAAKYTSMKALQMAANSSSAATSSNGQPEISGKLGASLAAWFTDAGNKLLLNELREAGVECCQEDPQAVAPQEQPADSSWNGISGVSGPGKNDVLPLEGLHICVTGTLSRIEWSKRSFVEAWITAKGGVFQTSVNKSTNMLVVGAKPGAKKIAAATDKGIPMLDEEGFVAELERLVLQKQGYVLD